MPRRSSTLDIHGVHVSVQRKRIKHLYVKVSRADGAVRVSAPMHVDDTVVRNAVVGKLAWIRAKQRTAVARSEPRFVDRERHLLWGASRPLRVVETIGCPTIGRPTVEAAGVEDIVLHLQPGSTPAERRGLLEAFYRAELEARIPELVGRWEPIVDRRVAEWRIRKMRTRWGSCNPRARRIWLSLELAKHPPEGLEYVVVHEMAHLIEANHSDRFYALMDRFMPDWRERKRLLTAA